MSAYLSDRRRGQAQSVDQVPELKRDPGQENPFRKKESRSSWKIRMYMTFEVCWIAIVALGLCTSWSPLSQGKKRKKTEKGKGKSIMSLIESPSFLLIPVSFPYILNHLEGYPSSSLCQSFFPFQNSKNLCLYNDHTASESCGLDIGVSLFLVPGERWDVNYLW